MQIVDSYPSSNANVHRGMYSGWIVRRGQSFTGDGGVLNSVDVLLSKALTPTGDITVSIYSHAGTFGTSSVGKTLLATADTVVAVSSLSSTPTIKSFVFSGANKITLENGTYYVVVINYSGGTQAKTGTDSTSPTHSGNSCYYSTAWSAVVGEDMIFYVYKDDPVAGTNMKINIGDSWKDVSNMKINIGDSWKDVSNMKINIGDSWKNVFG